MGELPTQFIGIISGEFLAWISGNAFLRVAISMTANRLVPYLGVRPAHGVLIKALYPRSQIWGHHQHIRGQIRYHHSQKGISFLKYDLSTQLISVYFKNGVRNLSYYLKLVSSF
jgi:hypothetical protein